MNVLRVRVIETYGGVVVHEGVQARPGLLTQDPGHGHFLAPRLGRRRAQVGQVHFGGTAPQHARQLALSRAAAGTGLLEPVDHGIQNFQSATFGQLDLDFPEADVRRVAMTERTFLGGQEVPTCNGVFIHLGQRPAIRGPQFGTPADARKVGHGF